MYGTFIEIRLDKKDLNNCWLAVSSEDRDWVEATFPNITDLLKNAQNKNHLIRSGWTAFAIQILGIIAGFALSLWAGLKIAPFLAIENAFVVSFFFAFIIFSNAWTYLNPQLLSLVDRIFPNIRFAQPNKQTIHWLAQGLVITLIGAPTIFLMDAGFELIGKILKEALFK